jgi:kynureninase
MEYSLEAARKMDEQDPLKHYRSRFIFPQHKGTNVVYFTGNSLGLQPKSSARFVQEVMDDWAQLAVEGHFYADKPWWDYHERLAKPLSKIVGAHPEEITVMNTLTVNLHLLLISFFRPQGKRTKILCEEKAFPSDQYMLQSQMRLHGLDPVKHLIEVKKRDGEHAWRTEDFIEAIEQNADELALVFIGGLNYYNGQVFDMERITAAGRKAGAFVGWDLAHAAGNVALSLHDWDVDFAAWCSYKYMNSGPGNASGAFVHKRHLDQKEIPRLEGWWGTKKETRFLMTKEFEPIPTADAWQLSNPPVLSIAPYLASLEMFDEVGMPALIEKQKALVAYLEFVLKTVDEKVDSRFEIITPPEARGSQLSVFLHGEGRALFDYLMAEGVIVDWREPNVIRLAPTPFYNSFEDLYRFGEVLYAGIQRQVLT